MVNGNLIRIQLRSNFYQSMQNFCTFRKFKMENNKIYSQFMSKKNKYCRKCASILTRFRLQIAGTADVVNSSRNSFGNSKYSQ